MASERMIHLLTELSFQLITKFGTGCNSLGLRKNRNTTFHVRHFSFFSVCQRKVYSSAALITIIPFARIQNRVAMSTNVNTRHAWRISPRPPACPVPTDCSSQLGRYSVFFFCLFKATKKSRYSSELQSASLTLFILAEIIDKDK